MKNKKLALLIGLGFLGVSCSRFIGGDNKPEQKPWEVHGLTKAQYEARMSGKSYHKKYYRNIDEDKELERIVVKSYPHSEKKAGGVHNYWNTVDIYVKRGVLERKSTLVGETERIVGEGTYTLKRILAWWDEPIKAEDVVFGNNVLKVQGREIVYNAFRDNFYFKKDLEAKK
nr:hypothetical protein [Nanoarchaeota archaeon]